MRRMITEKELSFFDSYAQTGAIGKYQNIIIPTDRISEWSGVKNIAGYFYLSDSTSSTFTIDFNGAHVLDANVAFQNTKIKDTLIIKNLTSDNNRYAFAGNNICKNFNLQNVKLNKDCSYLFSNSTSLEQILGDCDISGAASLIGAFNGCSALKKIQFKHFRADFDISASTAFDAAALVEIISNLDDTGSAHTLTMGATNLAKLSEAQKKVATDKGWNLA